MIEVDQVSLTYDGLRDAVSTLTFNLEPGSILALVGPNGAGKTSTLRMLAALTPPTRGTIHVDGHDVVEDRSEVCRLIGFLPDHFALYEQMTPAQLLTFFARCHDVPPAAVQDRVDGLFEELELAAVASTPVRQLSRGMRQRVGLAKTLVHDPRVLILDEPASALDPDARAKLQQTLLRLRKRGLAILVSSHILPELASIVDAVAIMDHGRAVYIGPLDRAPLPEASSYLLEATPAHKVRQIIAGLGPRVLLEQQLTPRRFQLTVRSGEQTVADLVQALVLRGVRVSRVAPRASRLEAVYRASMARRQEVQP